MDKTDEEKVKEQALQALRKQTQTRFATFFEPEQRAALEAALLAPETTSFAELPEETLTALNTAMDGVRVQVDSPDKWPEAKDVRYEWMFDSLQGKVAFNLRAISRTEEDEIIAAVPTPTRSDDKPKAEAERESQMTMAMFALLTIERGWGGVFPGKTPKEKVEWADENLAGQIGVYEGVRSTIEALSGYGTMTEWLIPRDKSGRTAAVTGSDAQAAITPVSIANPEAWAKIATGDQVYRIHRAGLTYEWPIRPVNVKRDREISKQTEDPEPPQVQQYSPGINRPCGSKPNPDDPAYIATLERNMRIRRMLHIEAALPFDIPGANEDEKCAWLAQRPAGDVKNLYHFVTVDMHNLGMATDFF